MPRFNKVAPTTKTTNLAGGEAFSESPELELASMVLTSLVQDQFYRPAEQTLARLSALVDAVDPRFAAQAAILARTEFGLRSITHALAGELAIRVRGERWTRGFYESVVVRPDDITEILAYLSTRHGVKPGSVPNALRDGLGRAFARFDAYQLGKYRGEGQDISLIDAVNVLHPQPTDRNREALAALVKGTLRQTGTWEDKLTSAGESEDAEEAKEEAWRELLTEGKLGYFALLRNLRNILKQAPSLVDTACEQLVDPERIKRSKVLPFRFLTAYETLVSEPGSAKVLGALEQALEVAVDNVPRFEGKTLVVLDESGSMTSSVKHGQPSPLRLGSVLAAALAKSNGADVMLFSNQARLHNIGPSTSCMSFATWMTSNAVGRGTDFHSIFNAAKVPYDRIIILSDMQGWVGYHSPAKEFAEYKKRTGADPHVYSIDLQGYGTLQFPERQVLALAGFSEKMFDTMALLEQDRNALVNRIKAIELPA